ncbi:hypothetical protein A3Q56_05960 [Intoshia linei]|uniref:SUEL-type lectin domain-containing protein n=1 Tax=Intoshia linei TaxID=1819745 RepID=A0A177AXT7_9BILA|nr:hypothetical protein A3Q56_05960 [Intoshia linei]
MNVAVENRRPLQLLNFLIYKQRYKTDKIIVCQWDNFNITCIENKQLLIKKAIYGRMNHGKCISKKYGNIGCHANVLSILVDKCGGKKSCQFINPIKPLREAARCPSELSSYLIVHYSCVTVLEPQDWCNKSISLVKNRDKNTIDKVYLAIKDSNANKDVVYERNRYNNVLTGYENVYFQHQPSNFECNFQVISPSQFYKINLFGIYSSSRTFQLINMNAGYVSKYKDECNTQIFIKDNSSSVYNFNQCLDEFSHYFNIYTTLWNKLKIKIKKQKNTTGQLLIEITVSGCATIDTPINGTIITYGYKSAKIQCKSKTDIYQIIQCQNNQWDKITINCLVISMIEYYFNILIFKYSINFLFSDVKFAYSNNVLYQEWNTTQGIILISAMGTFLGLIFGIVSLIGVYFFQKRLKRKRKIPTDQNATWIYDQQCNCRQSLIYTKKQFMTTTCS